MRPQDQTNSSNNAPGRNIAVPERDAAANVVRSQIDDLYNGHSAGTAAATPNNQPAVTPKQSSASTPSTTANNQTDPWQQYHSAWQDYYQQYYERYYAGHVQKILNEQAPKKQEASKTDNTTDKKNGTSKNPKESVDQLRDRLRNNVQSSAKKVRKSRHFIPIAAACVVVTVVAFLQYNSILMATVQAYVSPGAINPQNIIVDPTASVQVGADPKLIIPKINVDVPVVYGVGNGNDAQMAAMEKGVAHFAIPGANSVPGQIGNTAISGHSSNDLFEPGDYKFIFAQLDKLQNGDIIYANYEGVRYSYSVTKKEVVGPNDASKLVYQTDKPVMTLITCTPLGTSTNRLLVTAEQISPDPAKAAPAATAAPSGSAEMPGNTSSALQKLFGQR